MNAPLNSRVNAGQSGSTNTTAADWASKLSSGNPAGKSDQATMQSDFSRWMANAAATSTQASTAATQFKADVATPARNAAGPQGTSSASVEARNALARAQANAAQAKRQAPVTKAETPHPAKAEKPKASQADANKSAKTNAAKANQAKDGADKPDRQADGAQQDELAADAAKAGVTPVEGKDPQQADGAAATDPSSMLAWLASLTQGASAARAIATGEAPQGGTGAQAQGQATDGPVPAATGHDALAAIASAGDKGAAGAIDVSALQAAEGRLALTEGGADASAKGADFASTLSTEMMRGLAGKTGEANAAAQTSATLAPSVHSPEFPQALAERVGMWVHAAGEDGTLSAELHLNPAEMGPISVKISLDGQSAQVDFAAANLETRRAIEASLPMLSASLDDAGLKLGGSGVSDQTPQQQFNQQAPGQSGAPAWGGAPAGLASGGAEAALEGRATAAAQAGRRGGLDLYA